MTVCWDIEPCSLVEFDIRFGGAYCLRDYMEQYLEVSHLYGCRRKSLNVSN